MYNRPTSVCPSLYLQTYLPYPSYCENYLVLALLPFTKFFFSQGKQNTLKIAKDGTILYQSTTDNYAHISDGRGGEESIHTSPHTANLEKINALAR